MEENLIRMMSIKMNLIAIGRRVRLIMMMRTMEMMRIMDRMKVFRMTKGMKLKNGAMKTKRMYITGQSYEQ